MSADDLASLPVTGGAAPCNDLEQQGKEVELSGSREPAPTPSGGTIEDGTYVLVSSTLHTDKRTHGSKLMDMGRLTMRVSGSTAQLVRNAADGRERRTTVQRVSSGTVTRLQTTCASPSPSGSGAETTRYTATTSSLQFITPGPAGTVVATYMKL